MKNIFYAALLCLLALPTWAGIGRHNLLVNFTTGPAIFYDPTSSASDGIGSGTAVRSANDARATGIMGIEVGYLFHSVRGSTIQGMDLRIGIWGDLPTSGYSDGTARYKNPIIFSVAINYTPGIQFKSMRLLFDVIGINVPSAFANAEEIGTGRTGSVYSPAFIWTLPLGTHFMLNNGAYFGIRHHLVINSFAQSPTVPKVKYALLFNIGYAFGK
ncbi:MAG: hypothetical protein ACRCY4_04690 [Brevinema sp.]